MCVCLSILICFLTHIQTNVEKAQKKQKESYDNKHNVGNCFGVGSLVLKKDFLRKKRRGGKLDDKWLGPYTVTAALGKGLFKLKEVNGDKVFRNSFFYNTMYTVFTACIEPVLTLLCMHTDS